MLEFQESFFKQEIRDRFYLDTTMKTLWASELEVLQKIAEVCDKYGLTWYAAYGTLLGAIRHEGFVPWDDDMDIWLPRKDYNVLMKVLPNELPKGYHVKGPLSAEDYEQFHACINNGEGISIAKEWLEQFHNCPFTIGIDIFPLDYLPRNEEDRELQKSLFLIAGRVAQVAKKMDRGDYDAKEDESEEEARERKQSIIKEMDEGIAYLEENCKLPVNRQLFEEENWYSLCSEMWKWANHIAMMYNEEESDYLVEYADYTMWEHKKFPKEWFSEVYGASYEGFMVPVPSGYDQILRLIYGDYWIYLKKGGMHEYPFYARQLKQLREYVKEIEEKAEAVGLKKIEDIEVREESTEIPAQWLPIVTKEDGSRKKLILSANDPDLYVTYGDEALDKLEQTFKTFEAKKEQFTLWWRPHPVMRKILNRVSTDLGDRYQQILEQYKSAGYGICDETDNTECAVENCDAYYGEMNAVLQPFQNAEKPIMITHVDEEGTDHEQ